MANEVTTTVATSRINSELLSEEIAFSVRERALMLPLMKEIDLRGQKTKVGTQQFQSAITISSYTEGTGFSNAAAALTETTVTTAMVGAKVVVEDFAQMTAVGNRIGEIAEELGKGIANNVDAAAAALLGGFSTTVANTGVNMTLANLQAGIAAFNIAAKGLSDRGVIVLYPQQVADLQVDAIGASTGLAPVLANDRLASIFGDNLGGYILSQHVGSYAGIPIFQSTNVPTANSGADSAGAIFAAGDSLMYAISWDPTVELDRMTSQGIVGTAVVAHMAYGVAERRDGTGVSLIFDR